MGFHWQVDTERQRVMIRGYRRRRGPGDRWRLEVCRRRPDGAVRRIWTVWLVAVEADVVAVGGRW
jgi:hypothetical protein